MNAYCTGCRGCWLSFRSIEEVKSIVVFVQPRGELLQLSGATDVFAVAALRSGSEADYTVRIVAETADPIPGLSGARLVPDYTIEDDLDGPIDTLVITGSYPIVAAPSAAAVGWIRKQVHRARRWGSLCTGAFLLGAAGLLEGKRVTTHWEFLDQLAEAYPSAIVERDPIFVRDGPMFSSAGVSASIDLSLAFVEEDYGRELALSVARFLVMFLKRSGGQSQFSVHLAAQIATRPPIEQILDWIRDHPTADLSNLALARQAAMSERNFARLFRQQTGMTSGDFVAATRVDVARRLLEATGMPLQRVAAASGFSGLHALRRAFIRRLGVSPTDYRTRFRSAL